MKNKSITMKYQYFICKLMQKLKNRKLNKRTNYLTQTLVSNPRIFETLIFIRYPFEPKMLAFTDIGIQNKSCGKCSGYFLVEK